MMKRVRALARALFFLGTGIRDQGTLGNGNCTRVMGGWIGGNGWSAK
jgi:hypothetical protein